MLKPLDGAGGSGIRLWDGRAPRSRAGRPWYCQELLEGDSYAAIHVGDGQSARLLGVTRQLVGEPWLHAAAFHYCGSIGPIDLELENARTVTAIGSALAQAFGLKGLFGVDFILNAGGPYPVEVNPRTTASVEVIEYATGLRTLALHREVFEASGGRQPPGETRNRLANAPRSPVIGKAILFAPQQLGFPGQGPWDSAIAAPIESMPDYADLPCPGTAIKEGQPILTLFQSGVTVEACREALRRRAGDLDRWLFGR